MSIIVINALLGIGFGREAFEVFGGAGTASSPWKAIMLGDPSNQIEIVDGDADDTYTIFPFVQYEVTPPEGYSATGDRVLVRLNPHAFDEFPSPPNTNVLIGEAFEAVTWAWGTTPQLGDNVFALLYRLGRDGTPDRWFFAVPSEITLLEKNTIGS